MSKYLRVTMPDGSKWDVPAEVIAKDRAKFYAMNDTRSAEGPEYEKAYREMFDATMNDNPEIKEWASENMNWEDVAKYAERIDAPPPDYEEGWLNGSKEIVEYGES